MLSLYPAGLQHLHQPRRKREKTWCRERERDEADELGLMELKAKPIPRWVASFLGCLKHLHQHRRKREKRGYREEREIEREREREKERERERERERKRGEADELGLMELKAKLIPR